MVHSGQFQGIPRPSNIIYASARYLSSPGGRPDGIDHRVTRLRAAARASVSPGVCHAGEEELSLEP